MGGGQGVRALAQRRPRHRQGVDRIGLARSALAAAACAHQLRGDTDHSLAGIHQEALKGAGDVTAVLDCPDPLWIKTATPVEEFREAGLARGRRQFAGELAGSRKYRAAGVSPLVGVRSDHDHLACPFDWFVAFGRTSG
jgi:hypothetical protein